MKGAASRVSALVIAVCAVAGAAYRTNRRRTAGDHRRHRQRSRLGELHPRSGRRRREALLDRAARHEADGRSGHQAAVQRRDAVRRTDPRTERIPLNHPKCDISAQNGCIEEIDGGRFDLVGAYGVWSTLEVGADFPFVMQESIDYVGGANAEERESRRPAAVRQVQAPAVGARGGRDRPRDQRADGIVERVPRLRQHRTQPVPLDALPVRARAPSAGMSASSSTSTIRRMCSTGASRASSAPRRCSRCAARSTDASSKTAARPSTTSRCGRVSIST